MAAARRSGLPLCKLRLITDSHTSPREAADDVSARPEAGALGRLPPPTSTATVIEATLGLAVSRGGERDRC